MKRKVGANAPCPCGSGRKYKRCCMDKGFDWLEDDEGGIARSVPRSPEMRELINEQLERFREHFGRDPEPNEPLFFDMPPEETMEFQMVRAMKEAGIPPEFIYAYEKTGLVVSEQNQHLIPEADVEQWYAAIDEYFDRKEAGEPTDITPEDFTGEASSPP